MLWDIFPPKAVALSDDAANKTGQPWILFTIAFGRMTNCVTTTVQLTIHPMMVKVKAVKVHPCRKCGVSPRAGFYKP